MEIYDCFVDSIEETNFNNSNKIAHVTAIDRFTKEKFYIEMNPHFLELNKIYNHRKFILKIYHDNSFSVYPKEENYKHDPKAESRIYKKLDKLFSDITPITNSLSTSPSTTNSLHSPPTILFTCTKN